MKQYFFQEIPFINRIKEKEYFMQYFSAKPDSILFVYGPKSTGKTTLINKVIKELPTDEYAISYLDMRGVLIKNFADFKNIFFPLNLKDKIKTIVSGISVSVGFFGRSVDDEALLQTNIFAVMEQKLRQANEQGIKPVIIIDEFQYLKNIIIDKEHNLSLVEELFKFFIRLTKVQHLCHIVCLTSDSYYIEELYTDAKLKNTSEFFMMEHLSQSDIQYRLGTLESCPQEMVDDIREGLGGSVWEIRQVFVAYKNTGDYKARIDLFIQDEYAKIFDYRMNAPHHDNKKKFDDISTILATKGEYAVTLKDYNDNVIVLIKEFVDNDIRFYDARTQTITANSQSVRKAFQKMYAVSL